MAGHRWSRPPDPFLTSCQARRVRVDFSESVGARAKRLTGWLPGAPYRLLCASTPTFGCLNSGPGSGHLHLADKCQGWWTTDGPLLAMKAPIADIAQPRCLSRKGSNSEKRILLSRTVSLRNGLLTPMLFRGDLTVCSKLNASGLAQRHVSMRHGPPSGRNRR